MQKPQFQTLQADFHNQSAVYCSPAESLRQVTLILKPETLHEVRTSTRRAYSRRFCGISYPGTSSGLPFMVCGSHSNGGLVQRSMLYFGYCPHSMIAPYIVVVEMFTRNRGSMRIESRHTAMKHHPPTTPHIKYAPSI